MTKEELFKINFPEYCTKKECLSPYYDLFEAGIEIATCEINKITVQPLQKRIQELEAENERIKTKYYELQNTLKNVRLALIKERTANIMNYGKGGVEMFNDCFEILKGVSI